MHTKDAARRSFFLGDLLLQQHQTLQKGFWPRRTTGDVDIDRQDLVDPLHDTVNIVHAAGVGAAAHRHDPLGVGHLLVDPQHAGSHLLERCPGNDHQVRFARRTAQNLGTETGQVETRRHAGHHLDKTAGEAEEHRPEAVLAPPVDGIIEGGQNDIRRQLFAHETPRSALRLSRCARGPQSRPPVFQRCTSPRKRIKIKKQTWAKPDQPSRS